MNGVNFTFDGNYLVAEIDNTASVVNYQLEMLIHTEVQYLLPIKKQMKNNRIYLYYENMGKMPLNRSIIRKKMSDVAYVLFVKSTLMAVRELDEYQLSIDGILLDDNYIFVNPIDFVPSFAYLPIYSSDNGINNIILYLKNMLVSDMVDIGNSNIMQQVISVLNSGADINSMISQLDRINIGSITQGNNINIPPVQSSTRNYEPEPVPAPAPKPMVATNSVNKPEIVPAKPSIQPKVDNNKPQMPASNAKVSNNKDKNVKSDVVESEIGSPDMKKIKPILLGITMVIIIAFAAIVSSGTFNDENGQFDYTILIAVPIFIVAIDYFIYSKLKTKFVVSENKAEENNVNKKKKSSKKNNQPKNNKEVFIPVTEIKEDFVSAPQKPVVEKAKPEFVQPNLTSRTSEPTVSRNNSFTPDFFDYGKTEVLINDEIVNPFLQNREGNKISINNSITRIGKLKEQVDAVILNPKVSRVHADIIMREGKLYVMDLGSANGTYINGSSERITSNMEYELHNNDKVVFANEEYTVYC